MVPIKVILGEHLAFSSIDEHATQPEPFVPTYQLQIAYLPADDGGTVWTDQTAIEADTDTAAVVRAKEVVQETHRQPVHSAILRTSDRLMVWSLRSPEAG